MLSSSGSQMVESKILPTMLRFLLRSNGVCSQLTFLFRCRYTKGQWLFIQDLKYYGHSQPLIEGYCCRRFIDYDLSTLSAETLKHNTHNRYNNNKELPGCSKRRT